MSKCFKSYEAFYTGDVKNVARFKKSCSEKCYPSKTGDKKSGKTKSFKNEMIAQVGAQLKAESPQDPMFEQHVRKRAECQRSCLSRQHSYQECDAYCYKMDKTCYNNCRKRSTRGSKECSQICGYAINLD